MGKREGMSETKKKHQKCQWLELDFSSQFEKRKNLNPSSKSSCRCRHTCWKCNVEPENDGLEDDFPFPGAHSPG